MKNLRTFEEFVNESEKLNEAIDSHVQILNDLGFTNEIEWKGGNRNFKFYQGPAIKHENFHHKKLEDYSISFMDGHKYTGFYIWDYKGKTMHFIWKRKLGSVDWNKMGIALEKIASQMSKGKLPKGNPEQVKKHYNS